MAVERRKLRRSTRLLQLFSLMLMGAGAVCLLPLPSTDFWTRIGGVLAIASGSAGVVGLAFTWYRALVAFTACSWGAARWWTPGGRYPAGGLQQTGGSWREGRGARAGPPGVRRPPRTATGVQPAAASQAPRQKGSPK